MVNPALIHHTVCIESLSCNDYKTNVSERNRIITLFVCAGKREKGDVLNRILMIALGVNCVAAM